MSLSNPVGQFGVHSVCFYNRSTGIPITYLRVLGGAEVSFESEFTDLMGGSNLYNWDSEISAITSDVNLTAREYEAGAMELLLGGTLTENAAEATGAIEDLANVNGTSVYGSAGISDVALSTATGESTDDLKEGKYVIKAVSSSTVDIYALSDVDFQNGTDKTYVDDTLKITSSPLTITASSDTVVSGYGFTLTGGDATGGISMTIDDTAEFYVRKENSGSIELVFGASGSEFSEVGAILTSQKQADGTVTYLELYRCKVGGMPINFTEKAWSEWSVTVKALFDSDKNAIGKYRRTRG